MFHRWGGLLGDTVEVLGVQLPGRGTRLREPPFRRMDRLVAALQEVIAPLSTVPYAIFGHSLGATVGFELARAMRRSSMPLPVHLVLSARRAPQLPPHNRPIHHLPQAAFLTALEQRYGTADRALRDPEIAAMMFPSLQSDIEILETATLAAEEPLAVPISAIGALGDPSVSRADLEAWRELSSAKFVLHLLAGDHFYLLRDPAPLLSILRSAVSG